MHAFNLRLPFKIFAFLSESGTVKSLSKDAVKHSSTADGKLDPEAETEPGHGSLDSPKPSHRLESMGIGFLGSASSATEASESVSNIRVKRLHVSRLNLFASGRGLSAPTNRPASSRLGEHHWRQASGRVPITATKEILRPTSRYIYIYLLLLLIILFLSPFFFHRVSL
ncbi:unnamed protein product [Protopolystoma xenopodis]|uniref:Uncharacterized protein n=1 Tax=Protopolystoma xenopodis TaxID=117903 RepID=A0A3S5B4L9_9PLAT|nr:unnamed protein product [Protopolystoma xenopodis]